MNHVVEIEEIGDPLAHDRRAEKTLAAGLLAHRDRLFGNIEDLVDHHTHTAFAVVEDNHLHRIGASGFDPAAPGSSTCSERHQRQDAVPVLHHLAPARMLDGGPRKLLEPGDQRQRNRQALEGAGPEQQQPLLLDSRLRLLFGRRARLLTGFGQHPGALADARAHRE